ncbi:MAG: ABC transporter ATP-binding protein [Proteobacteria bacterium]|nr:ABC transporter ATP-binding protein [Pseudomonadota bacterium]
MVTIENRKAAEYTSTFYVRMFDSVFSGQRLKSLLRLVPFLRQYRHQIIAGFAAFFGARLFEVSSYYLVAMGIDAIGVLYNRGATFLQYSIGEITWAIIACVLLRFIFVVFARRSIRRVGIALSFDLRQKLYASVQVQGSDFFSRIGVGDIMTRAIQDITLIQRLVAFGMIFFVIMTYAPLFSVSAMLFKSPALTLVIVPVLPVIFIYAYRMTNAMAETSKTLQQRLSDLSTHTQENLSGIRTVQAQVQEANEIRRFGKTNDEYAKAFYAQARINSLMTAWMPFFASISQLAIIMYGGYLVLDGEISIGDLVFFFACLNMLLQPIRMAGMFVTLVQRAAVATDRLFEIYDAEPEIADNPSHRTPRIIRGEFDFRDLSFTYPRTEKPVLQNINLHVQAGESIAIVGRVGSGKSTLLKLFTRLLEVSEGQLLLDGHDVRDYPLAQLRTQIAQILQDPFLFGEPLRNNISYDDPQRQLEVIWDSAEAAALRDTIEEFPAQMETIVGERGVTLSGGQKQRTALARGLIRDAPVLILDDCFSSVDTETEEHILSRLKNMRKDKTTILVSHRISTLRHSDRIIVMDEGRIVEMGSHQELVRRKGIYAQLERVQTERGSFSSGSGETELMPSGL